VANKPIRIEFVAEVANYLRETKKLEVSTEDIADALNATTKNSEDLERKLGKAMRSAGKDAESLERVLKDIPKATDQAADKASKDFDRIGDDARDAGREVGDEFRQNLGESLSSGSMEDLVSDTLGGIVGSMKGPLGLAAAGVAGVGALIFNKLKEDWQSTTEAMKTAAQSLVDMQIEVGRQILFNSEKQKLMQDLVKEDPELWAKVREQAEMLGLTLGDVGDAIFGGEDAMAALKQKLMETVDQGKILNTGADQYGQKLTPAAAAAASILGYLQGQQGEIDKASLALDNYRSIMDDAAYSASILRENLRMSNDYAAGLGGRAPLVGRGEWRAG
jgi:hypothetical protein